jgi:hypothetical protein
VQSSAAEFHSRSDGGDSIWSVPGFRTALQSRFSNLFMAQSLIDKDAMDVAQVFQTFMTFCGDVARTAAATGLTAEQVTTLANSEHWDEKLQLWNTLKDGDSKELQIQINRAVTYVQAHRLRSILDRLVSHLTKKSDDDLVQLLTKQFHVHVSRGSKNSTVDRTEFSTRPLTDLVRAAKECADMTAKIGRASCRERV